jgi:hypothetical protein
MEFIFNDGGRAKAGFKGKASDCVCRSIAIATGKPYQEIYDVLADMNESTRKTKRTKKTAGKKTADKGIYTTRKAFKDYMVSLGFSWVSTMGIGTGCKVHLKASEIPAGVIIARVTRHYCCVIDGVIHDTHDPSRNESRCVYGYWKLN